MNAVRHVLLAVAEAILAVMYGQHVILELFVRSTAKEHTLVLDSFLVTGSRNVLERTLVAASI